MDRRAHVRQQRLLKLEFQWDGKSHTGVTTDVSIGGAFVNTSVYPAEGTVLDLVHRPDGSPHDVILRARIQRVADPSSRHSVLPGIGVEWLEVSTEASPGQLRWILQGIFRADLEVRRDADGHARWLPNGEPSTRRQTTQSQFFRDLKSLEDVLPEPTGPDVTGQSGRRAQRRATESHVEVNVYVRGIPSVGWVQDVSMRGMWIESDQADLPDVGEIAQIHYPLPCDENVHYARLVGAVVRTENDGAARGFAIAIIRVHDMGQDGAFQFYVTRQEALRERRELERARQLDTELHARPEQHRRSSPDRSRFRRGTQLKKG